jgi:hypothetical protein
MNKRMKEVTPKFTSNNQPMTYSEFLSDSSGTGEIYDEMHKEVINAASHPETDWLEVDDYLVPLASQILTESIETDKDIYKELVVAIQKAYDKLTIRHKEQMEKEQREFEADSHYVLDRDSESFTGELDGFLHEISIKGKYIKSFDNQPLGRYEIVVGYQKETTED